MRPHAIHDLSAARRVLIVGDVHGHLDLLRKQLASMQFNTEKGDWLISVGDLVDRGPQSLAICEWMMTAQNFLHVAGNHEEMFYQAVVGNDKHIQTVWIRNGGNWGIQEYDSNTESFSEKLKEHARRLYEVPISLEILTPQGNRVGIVHAECPEQDWAEHVRRVESVSRSPISKDYRSNCLWSRARIKEGGSCGSQSERILNIDHVFHGHTITQAPKTHGNMSWIDTGAYRTGCLTIINADDWVASCQTQKETAE